MKKLSTGEDATLENYLNLSKMVFGSDSKAVKYLEDKIAKEGPKSEVIADELQVVYALTQIHAS